MRRCRQAVWVLLLFSSATFGFSSSELVGRVTVVNGNYITPPH